jgi:ABC-type lipoprotein export system ATPase subunit
MALFEDIYQRGNTIILVTHERDIARHARRTVNLRDGLIESDETGAVPAFEPAVAGSIELERDAVHPPQ